MNKGLERFKEAQESVYAEAFSEIQRGKKQGHWMWFIFPQIQGLGSSETSRFFAIKDAEEGSSFLKDPVLGSRLINTCNELLKLETHNAHVIFGSPDDIKLKSSMTLFSALPGTNPVFDLVLKKFFQGEKDTRTLELIH
jgi:uncharacterized protein (DUF1810 family)